MFRLRVMLLFTSLDKHFGDGPFLSNNVTGFFLDKLESVHCYRIFLSDLPELGYI